MIGPRRAPGRRRAATLGAVAVLLAGGTFAARPAGLAAGDPPRHAAAVTDALAAIDGAEHALDEAASALAGAIDAARAASTNAFTGETVNGSLFTAAAVATRAAAGPVDEARMAVGRVAQRTAALGLEAPRPALDGSRAVAAGDGIEAATAAAEGFAGLRGDTALALDELAGAVDDLGRGDHAAALGAADRVDEALVRIEPYAVSLPQLRLWLETAGDLNEAVRAAARALREGDAAAAAAAEARLRDAAGEAAVSDRALALAISEGASRVLGTPLGQLGRLAREVADAQDALVALRRAVVARAGGGEAT
ncbi:MAG TPA: hypothetical protein VFM19_06945 [Candidatus Limnocylindria bacterium]|nr:hypothetical protein [Candidatus Limnocylindria bacterium]